MTDAGPPLISGRLAVMLQEQGGVNERLACERVRRLGEAGPGDAVGVAAGHWTSSVR